MLKQSPILYGKIKIELDYGKLGYSTQQLSFYEKYSSFTLKALRKTSYQQFLKRMLLSENIKETAVKTIYIKVYPALKKNGYTLAGRCNVNRGRIRIYPRTMKFCGVFRKKFGRETLFAYAGSRARAALIHELLHLKYASDEEKVRELTKTYFSAYSNKHRVPALSVHDFLFKEKTVLAKNPKTLSPLSLRLNKVNFRVVL